MGENKYKEINNIFLLIPRKNGKTNTSHRIIIEKLICSKCFHNQYCKKKDEQLNNCLKEFQMSNYKYSKGEKCYYITSILKRCLPVEIIDIKETIIEYDIYLGESYRYDYLIKFSDGTIKIVNEKRLF